MPKFGGDRGKWVYERFIILDCNNVIPPEKQDKLLVEKMFAEREGIVQKAIYELIGCIEDGYRFSLPESSNKLLQRYTENNSHAITFYKECCVMRSEGNQKDNCTCKRMHDVFKAWCRDNCGGYIPKIAEFKAEIAEYLEKEVFEIIKKWADNDRYIFTLNLKTKRDYHQIYGSDAIPQKVPADSRCTEKTA